MNSVEGHGFVDVRQLEALGHPQPEVIVLEGVDPVAADDFQGSPAQHYRRMTETIPPRKHRVDDAASRGHAPYREMTAVGADEDHGSADDRYRRVSIEKGDLQREAAG